MLVVRQSRRDEFVSMKCFDEMFTLSSDDKTVNRSNVLDGEKERKPNFKLQKS